MGVTVFPAVAIPAGMLMPFAGTTVPDGWLACNGAEVSKTQYPNLWLSFGQTHIYGTPADPTNNFLLPNLKGKVIVGQDSGQTEFAALAQTGGSKTSTAAHTHTMGNHTHAMATHDHSLSNHTHTLEQHWHDLNGHYHTVNGHAHGGGTGVHAHTCLSNVYVVGTPAHGHDGAGAQSSERPNVTTGFSSPGNPTDSQGIGNSIEAPNTGGPVNTSTTYWYGAPQGAAGPVSNLSGAAQDIGTAQGPNINTSDGSSVGVASGNLQPYMTLIYMIKT